MKLKKKRVENEWSWTHVCIMFGNNDDDSVELMKWNHWLLYFEKSTLLSLSYTMNYDIFVGSFYILKGVVYSCFYMTWY